MHLETSKCETVKNQFDNPAQYSHNVATVLFDSIMNHICIVIVVLQFFNLLSLRFSIREIAQGKCLCFYKV